MSNYAQTVTGTIPVSDLGWTLMHEHLLCDLRLPAMRDNRDWPKITMENRFQTDYFQNRNQMNMVLDEDAAAERELLAFRANDGGSIVELTVGGMEPQPERLATLSAKTGVPVIMGAGYYVDAYVSEDVRGLGIDGLEEVIRNQLTLGAWETFVKAGLIGEIGCSWPLMPFEQQSLIAAARAQRATGAAITIHPGRHPDAPAQIADILEEAGADPSRTIIGHMDRTIFDRDRFKDLLRRGFVLEWDFFGLETSQYWMADEDLDLPTDYMRLDLIADLMGCGYCDQITISHDICTKTRLASYGGHGYSHLIRNMIPMMRRRGWPDANIEHLLKTTPARLLGYLTNPQSVPSSSS